MPELPEVETVRRGLEPVLAGRRLDRVEQRRADLRWPLPARFAERLTGRRVETLGRRSKYLLIGLAGDHGAPETPPETWLVHLGMSGRLTVGGAVLGAFQLAVPGGASDGTSDGASGGAAGGAAGPGPHDHVIVTTDTGAVVTYNDVRRFGVMDLWPTEGLAGHRLLAGLGPEPLGNAFGGAYLADAFKGKRTSAKAALMDQRVVAGLGNIYVSEALHRAGVHPARVAGSLSRARVERLARAIVDTLEEAIAAGGSSLRDYRQSDGELGYFQHAFRVYDREGAACPAEGCRGKVRRLVQAGRSSYCCPRCQR